MGAGRKVSAAQVKELQYHLQQRTSLKYAAMKAGMDRKTAGKYREGASVEATAHTWRTRPDPLAEVWPRLEELLQGEPRLQAKTLVQWLEQEYPGQDWQRPRRTLERRVRQWRAQHGPAKEVFFRQVHEAGRLGSSDFTRMSSLGVTIQGQSFAHLLYHFVLTYSNWEHVSLCYSESFASLSAGLQNALWALGGVPERHRTDRMTLAVNHEGHAEAYTAKYRALLGHYALSAEATNAASGHENGDCEQGHRRLKEELEQALLLRGSREFASRDEYWQLVLAVVARRNARRSKFAEEQARLRSLPAQRLETLEQQQVRVGQGSTIQVKKNTYSVPARLIGERVAAQIGADQIEVWYAGELVQTMERLRGQGKHRIDYRHVIDWLVRKPGAFARYQYQDELYPSVTFRRVYDALQAAQPTRADRDYVRLLHLAAHEGESRVEAALAALLGQCRPLSEQAVRTLLGKDTPLSIVAQVSVPAVDLRQYDALLEGTDLSDNGMSIKEPNKEVHDERGQNSGQDGGVGALPAGTALGVNADPVRSGGPAGDGGVLGLCRVPAGAAAARVPAAAAPPDRALAEGVEAGPGEELVGAGPQASADEGGATAPEPIERGLPGPSRECAGLWSARLGEDARPERRVAGAGANGPACAVHQVQPAGAGTAQGEAGPGAEEPAAGAVALGGPGDRRSGLRTAEPGGDGGAVHALGRALRARQRAVDEQPGVLALGADLQGSDDDGGGDRPAGAPQRDRGVERVELSDRGCETDARQSTTAGGLRDNEIRPVGRPGCATVVVAALRLPPLRQAAPPVRSASAGWGILIVAHGEG